VSFIISALIKSILLLSFVGFLLQIIRTLLHKMAKNSSNNTDEEVVHVVQESTLPLFENTALIAFYIIGFYLVFSIWNVDMTALLAGAGIGAMAVGMAAKDTLSDIIAGILILTDAPYRVGDVVYVKGNLKGRVSAIGLRNTRLVTKNNIEVIVPNTIMGTSQIVNESSSKEFGIRIQLDVSVAFGEDVEVVKLLLINSANKAKKVAQDKEIKALMIGFEQYALQFRLQCWIGDPEDKGSAKGELMELIYLNFYNAGIDVAMTREQNINMVHEQLPPQEIRITQFPETNSNVHVKEFPDTKQDMHIKEVPNLFGTANMKKMTKVTKVKDGDEK
jgi:small-conductance mechanosensitive channel